MRSINSSDMAGPSRGQRRRARPSRTRPSSTNVAGLAQEIPMKRAAFIALAAGGLLLTACVSMSSSSAFQSLPSDLVTGGRVDEIKVTRGDLKVTPEFNTLFEQKVKAKLDGCARGTRGLRL